MMKNNTNRTAKPKPIINCYKVNNPSVIRVIIILVTNQKFKI